MSTRAFVLALAVCATVAGFAAGAFVIGPQFSDEDLAEAAAARRAERFAPRSVDLSKDYPEPFAYRTRSPVFPDHGPTGVAAAARSRALETYGSGGRDIGLRESPFEAFADRARAPQPRVRFDRHTGVAY